MKNDKNSKMGLGLFFGMILGALGGLFLAPKSGKENREIAAKKIGEMKGMIESGELRERVEKIFGDISDESVRIYTTIQDEITKKVEEMKTMDAEDYAKMVQEAIEKVKKGTEMGTEQLKKLKDQFMKDYPEVKKVLLAKKTKSKK